MINEIKDFIKKNYNFVIALMSVILLTLLSIIFIFSSTTINNDNKSLNSIVHELNKINISLESCNNGLSINPEKSTEILTSNIYMLKDLQSRLQEVETSSPKYAITEQNLMNSLSSTINLYEFCVYIISNPSEIISGENLNNFLDSKTEYLTSYSNLYKNNLEITLTNNTLLFWDNFYNYINSIIKVNRNSEIESSQHHNFIIELTSLLPTLDNLTEDLFPTIKKTKEDEADIQLILDSISIKEKNFSDVKRSIANIAIPDSSMEFYKALQDFLKIYDVYIDTVKDALLFEKNCSDKEKYSIEIEKKYNNAMSKYQDVIQAYLKFKDLINN